MSELLAVLTVVLCVRRKRRAECPNKSVVLRTSVLQFCFCCPIRTLRELCVVLACLV